MSVLKDAVAVIMAGGAGTRFWPLSTEERPKQFIALTGDRTLLQMSYDRIASEVGAEKVLVLTNAAYVELVAEQLPELPRENIIGEPCRRDTAGAGALAALLVEDRFGSVPMIVLTADHVVGPLEEFHLALSEAVERCGGGTLYTLGIRPTYPATQFGYLEMDQEIDGGDLPHFALARFKEKPDRATAVDFLQIGRFYWNSGMFVWQTDDIVAEFREHLPEHLEILRPVIQKVGTPEFAEAFARLQPISVDFAILEKAGCIQAVIPRIEWDDVGGWRAVSDYLRHTEDGNRVKGEVHSYKSSSNTVFLEDPEEKIVLLGVSDMVVVRSGGRTLVARKEDLDLIKTAVKEL